ncbi:MAG: helix-turn-helix domain-containing protein [Aulosira sp. ZfuVER01]|nr:AraC family transcriptional regulator [Aulosira sp. ZfuVER01]MDZ7999470.1 AraC family transcriptional regulator [Aulosira sp. DedVER01a]MDZ8054750.1 AraC family transcriptional regulator [Aulosira sp. ZfuCHP01]
MSAKQPLVIDCADWKNLLANPPLLTSFQSGWNNIHLAHLRQPSIDLPEVSSPQHTIFIAIGHQTVDLEIITEGRLQKISFRDNDYTSGCIGIFPAALPFKIHTTSTVNAIEMIQCYLEPAFLAQIAYESVNPDRVELLLIPKKADLLIQQIGLALKASLEVDGVGSCFYADSMATALSAHLIRHYSTRTHRFQDYEDGLSKQKLKRAIEYMQIHLGEDLSLNDIANELGMSQYYFCHLFKRSTGMSPHQYLIRQRVERAKQLLKQPELTVASIAMECGFASQSHFAKYFRQFTGMNPNQFRKF